MAPAKRRKLRQKVEGAGADVDAQREGAAAREARATWRRRWEESMVVVGRQSA